MKHNKMINFCNLRFLVLGIKNNIKTKLKKLNIHRPRLSIIYKEKKLTKASK